MLRRFYDSTLNYDWNMEPVDRSFDQQRVIEYLSHLNGTDRAFIIDLLDNTSYVDYQRFHQALMDAFEKFRQDIGDEEFVLMLPNDKIGSEYWMVALLWPELRNMRLRGFINQTSDLPMKGTTHILIIDDAIYSGTNIVSSIDHLTYNLHNRYGIPQEEVGSHMMFHIVVPFVSSRGSREIFDFCIGRDILCKIYSIYLLRPLDELVDVWKYYADPNRALYRRFGIESMFLTPVYFDQKVAGPLSTFRTIYLEGKIPGDGDYGSLLKNNPSRRKIDELARMLHSELAI